MIDMQEYGWTPDGTQETGEGCVARVTAVYRERYALICDRGALYGRLKTGAYFTGGESVPTAGDFVTADNTEGGDCRILRTLPRRTYFSRVDPSSSGHAAQAVAANFDYVLLVQSLNENFSIRRLERYLTLAWQSGAEPVTVLTKADLPGDHGEAVRQATQTAMGTRVFSLSARTGEGLDALRAYLTPGRTAVLLGSSGVGKSSLINALAGETLMEEGEIREKDGRGRHTTTHRQLLRLPTGLLVIDTPGMRELGMWDVSQGIGQSFADVEAYLGRCRFADCRHRGEPGCAVQQALEDGSLSRERWDSYRKLRNEAKCDDDREAYLQGKRERNRQISKYSRSLKKSGDIRR